MYSGMLMFCKNCGSQVEDGNLFCTSCGAKVEKPAAPVKQSQNEEFVLGSTEEVPVKKKSPKWILPVAIVAVVAVLVVGAILIFGGGNSSANLSGEEHLEKVEADAVGGYVDSLTNIYGAVTDLGSTAAGAAKLSVSVRASEDVMDLLGYAITGGYSELDLSWLNNITLAMEVDGQEDIQKMDMALLLSANQIINLSAVLDWDSEMAYVGIPDLSNTYLSFNMTELGITEVMDTAAAMQEMLDSADLPEAETLNKLLDKYIKLMLNSLPEVDKEVDTVSLDGLKQKCTILTVELSQKDLMEVVKAVLEEAKKDEELLDALEDCVAAYADYMNSMIVYESYDYYYDYDADYFADNLDMLAEQLDSYLDEDYFDDSDIITYISYVDNNDNIIGRKLEVDGAEIYYLTVTEGKNFRFEASLGEMVIEGEGTVSKNIVNGKYSLSAGYDGYYLDIEVSDFDKSKWAEGDLVGKFVLAPSDDMLYQMAGVDVSDAALALDLNITDSASVIDVEVLLDDVMMVGVTLKYEQTSAGEVSVPSNTVDGTSENDVMEWVLDLDYDELLNNLEKAGVPDEYLGYVEALVDQIR